ncbi:MAG: phosphoribosylamine--glycine ligase [Lentimicrobiaceae bacterium]|jgi:phosphoribosylamine--glycine ligase|nr:phosphoribosylamine--glycine ligase [Lentimicrobiaceae bacterium]
MNILVIGSGGRENAFAWKLKQSPKTTQLFIAPGNAGTTDFGINAPIDPTDFKELKKFCIETNIELIIVGPEQPLVEGIVDFFKNDNALNDIMIVGPNKAGAQLEGSKVFAKKFMEKYDIPTAKSFHVDATTIKEGVAFLKSMNAPYVLKADGLAAGKGVLIIDSFEEAEKELNEMLDGKFGEASTKVVIEEFLSGIEVSVFVLTDGKNYKILPEAKDYKRISDGDKGLNTGGMGAVSPVPFANSKFMQKVEEYIIKPTLTGLIQESIDYKGFIFLGLINVDGEPFVIEYNARMGDPETECVFPRIKTDFVDLMTACATTTLDSIELEIDERTAVTVVLVSDGYPESYSKGKIIEGLNAVSDCILFHAGTSIDIESEKIKTSGGRVLAVTALGETIEIARKKAYENVKKITFEGVNFRNDIGMDLIALNK